MQLLWVYLHLSSTTWCAQKQLGLRSGFLCSCLTLCCTLCHQYNPNSLFSPHGSFDLLLFPPSAEMAETMRSGWSKCHLAAPWVQTIWIKICPKIKNPALKILLSLQGNPFPPWRTFGGRLLLVNLLVLLLQSGEGLETPLKV